MGAKRATVAREDGRERGSGRILLIALALIAALFLVQGAVSHFLTRSIEERSWRTERDSIWSVERVAQLARDLERERVLIDDHIVETDEARMRAIDRAHDALLDEIRGTEEAYQPLVELPDEIVEWQHVSALSARFHAKLGPVLELSRANRNAEARATWAGMREDYEELHRGLSRLMEINRAGALESVRRIQDAERFADDVTDAVMLAALLGMLWTGVLATRRIRSYERRLQAFSEELRVENRDLDAFAERVTHDLRNALAPLAMAPELMRRCADEPVRIRALADRVERCSRRAEGVLDALLDFSRAARDVKPDESGSLRAALDDVVEEVGLFAAQHDVTVEANDVPDLAVRCDPRLLHVLLANLVGNAAKFLVGQRERRVRITACAEGASCRIGVADTGPGIPGWALGRIFEPFFRVDGTGAPGTGVGLATVRRIVDARGGRITVESAEGRGTRFDVWLPLGTGARSAEERRHEVQGEREDRRVVGERDQ